jgi:enterochelin esterase-like enzyme
LSGIILVVAPVAQLPVRPRGFDVRRSGIEHGEVKMVEYFSKAAGCRRRMSVYAPPWYSERHTYPVLYLLHGSVSDETSWVNYGAADTILGNLYADKKAVPMIVVMPNGNELNTFGRELLGDIMPYVEKRFPVKADRQHRALAGVSAGVVQAINFGLTKPDTFAHIGLFIGGLSDCAEFEKTNSGVLDELATTKKLNLLWIANGKNDFTYTACQDTLRLFDRHGIQYIYQEGQGIHSWETARNDLLVFAPLLFRDVK